MEEVDDREPVVERVAALDWARPVCRPVRAPHTTRPGARMQELRGYATTTAELVAMAAWLRQWRGPGWCGESTSTYWKGVYYLLEAEGFECWLVRRANTDKADAVWLATVAERGMCRPSLVHPPEIRRLRD
jgi:transposase